MVKRFLFSVALLIPVAIIAQIDWTKQLKNVPSYVTNALGDPGAAGFVKRTTANTSTVAGPSDVWPGTVPYSSVTSAPANIVIGGGTTVVGNIPEWNNTTGTLLQPGISPTGAWPGTIPFTSVTSTPNLLRDPGANGVVYRNALNTTAAATGAQLPLMVASGASHSAGAVPDPGAVAGTTHFLREDGTWQVASSYAGVTQQATWGSVGTRNIGVVYQNTTGKPLFVMAAVNINANGRGNGFTDGSNPPTTLVGTVFNSGSGVSEWVISFWVLPGNYYELVVGGSFGSWAEQW